MRVGIVPDIHDQPEDPERALEFSSAEGAETLLFCGDLCSPIPARVLGGYDGVVHCVFGNGDGDRFRMLQAEESGAADALRLHAEHAQLDVEDRRVALTHYPLYGSTAAPWPGRVIMTRPSAATATKRPRSASRPQTTPSG